MVTMTKNEGGYCKFAGLAADSKPTEGVATGSEFVEVDTGKVFMFNSASLTWVEEYTLGSSGGGSALPAYTSADIGKVLTVGEVETEEKETIVLCTEQTVTLTMQALMVNLTASEDANRLAVGDTVSATINGEQYSATADAVDDCVIAYFSNNTHITWYPQYEQLVFGGPTGTYTVEASAGVAVNVAKAKWEANESSSSGTVILTPDSHETLNKTWQEIHDLAQTNNIIGVSAIDDSVIVVRLSKTDIHRAIDAEDHDYYFVRFYSVELDENGDPVVYFYEYRTETDDPDEYPSYADF